jgi:hypothetical protein
MSLPDRSAQSRTLRAIAGEIQRDWGDKIYFGAVPYVRAMRGLEKVTDHYGDEDADDIVRRFLNNATTWRGDTARRVKAELKGMLK